jgi:hypothetical protein
LKLLSANFENWLFSDFLRNHQLWLQHFGLYCKLLKIN